MIRALRPWLPSDAVLSHASQRHPRLIMKQTQTHCSGACVNSGRGVDTSLLIIAPNHWRSFCSSSAEVYDEFEYYQKSSAIDSQDEPYNIHAKTIDAPHCKTCTCGADLRQEQDFMQNKKKRDATTNENNSYHHPGQDTNENESDTEKQESILKNQSNPSLTRKCHLQTPLFDPNTPLPPPHPNPTYSFKKRVLPPNLIAFTSKEGKQRFIRALTSNYAEAYYPLSQQFLNQSDPAYCGVTTLLVVLNAMAMDPNVRWRGGWRWYGDESMLLERCCLEEERVRREGISIEMFGGLARCQGVDVILKRPLVDLDAASASNADKSEDVGMVHSIDEFRKDIIDAVKMPPKTELDSDDGDNYSTKSKVGNVNPELNKTGGCFLVTSFSRSALKQTGDGHFSPISGYDPKTDSCLVLDVARFKYAPYWVKIDDLYNAMIPRDTITDKSRGWMLMYPPHANKNSNTKAMTVEEKEGKRLAACVPLAGSGIPLCVEEIKKEYCALSFKNKR